MPKPPKPSGQRDDKSLDKILRTLARHFVQDFVEILFPDVAGDVDFSSVKFVGEELFADFRKKGHVRPDLVVEMWSDDGEPQLALFHAELEYKHLTMIAKRLKKYSQQLSLAYDPEHEDVPILSAAVFVYGGPKSGLETRELVTRFKGLVTNRFYYVAFALSRSLAEEYVERPQAVAAALAAFMRSEVWDRVEQKIRCYEGVRRANVDEEERYLLVNVVDERLRLDEEERVRFEAEIRHEKRQEVQKMIQTFSEALADREAQGEARGKAEGKAEGMLQATRDAIVLLAKSLHGELPEGFAEKLDAIDSLERLHQILELVPKVRSLGEIDLEPGN